MNRPLKTVIFWVSLLVVNVRIHLKSNTSEDHSIVKVVKEAGHQKIMFIFMFMICNYPNLVSSFDGRASRKHGQSSNNTLG